jgi:hypothetical protein
LSGTLPYLQPDVTVFPAPLAGQDLRTFLQAWVVGVTGLPGEVVSVSYQGEPVNVPDADVPAWCAIKVDTTESDAFPYVGHQPGYDILLRHETLELRCSFYGLGLASQADAYAELLRDGVYVSYNRSVLQANGFGLVAAGGTIAAPNLLKERWQYKVDLVLTLHREVRRAYPVPDIAFAVGTIVAQGETVLDVVIPVVGTVAT